MFRVFQSACAGSRLEEARQFLLTVPAEAEAVVVGDSREAADDFVRAFSHSARATFGLHRFSLLQMATRVARPEMARHGLAPATLLGREAVAARVAFDVLAQGALKYFAAVAGRPGFARALAGAIDELRACGVELGELATLGDVGEDLTHLLRGYFEQLSAARIADPMAVLSIATRAVEGGKDTLVGVPIVLLDVAIHSRGARDFVAALCACAPRALATVPAGDHRTGSALRKIPCEYSSTAKQFGNSLLRLQNYVFDDLPSSSYAPDDRVHLFSAPGEGRECLEIARRILEEARKGVPFDQMAILVRAPETYARLLEAALERAQIPAHFARGTRRPDPAGRALVVLVACAAEGLSAKRFAEYLSLGQVPQLKSDGTPPHDRQIWSPARDDSFPPIESSDLAEHEAQSEPEQAEDSDKEPVLGGTLRAPHKWEQLLVEAAVVGGQQRWARRLDGLAAELRLKIAALAKVEPTSPRLAWLERELVNLAHLRRFALPIVEELAAWPKRANWGVWLAALERLAPKVLRRPERVLSVLAELKPMAAIGPVMVEEVRQVLSDRLTQLQLEPARHRYGRVFIGRPEDARGRSFAAVFVPGLAERIFPQKLREDPILGDELRRRITTADPLLITGGDRLEEERLRLRLTAGAADQRIYFSYPRVEVALARPRVPSFYALDVTRTIRGQLPNVDAFEREAAAYSNALLAWPAPSDPWQAIDDIEHDLAVLRPLLKAPAKDVSGRARYLMELNPELGRSLRSRWLRWHKSWTSADGLCRLSEPTQRILADYRLSARAYAPTSLQLFAACPYRFVLSTLHRLAAREEPAYIQSMDPATRGTMFHRVLAEFMREALGKNWIPLTGALLEQAQTSADRILQRVAAEFHELLAPAIERVWASEIDEMRADLHGWLLRTSEQQSEWTPLLVEFAFGSMENVGRIGSGEPIQVGEGFLLHGVIDLVEQNGHGLLRVTDYKTGKDRTEEGMVVGHGMQLQPVLYSLAIETARKQKVAEARLWYATSSGGYHQRIVWINDETRATGLSVLRTIDQAIAEGFLPPAPKDHACDWCDFRGVCGPYEELRVTRKDQEPLSALIQLRQMK